MIVEKCSTCNKLWEDTGNWWAISTECPLCVFVGDDDTTKDND